MQKLFQKNLKIKDTEEIEKTIIDDFFAFKLSHSNASSKIKEYKPDIKIFSLNNL